MEDGIAEEARQAVQELKSMELESSWYRDGDIGGRVSFAKNKVDLDLLRSVTDQTSDEKQGQIYGIPETAIKAYPDVMPDSQLPQDITKHPLFAAIPFMPSRANFRQEWNEYVHKATQVRTVMPTLVQQLDLEHLYR